MVVVDVGVGRGERVGGDHGEVVILVSNKFVGGWRNEDRGVYSLIFWNSEDKYKSWLPLNLEPTNGHIKKNIYKKHYSIQCTKLVP